MNALPHCPHCQRNVPVGALFCPTCGWDLQEGRARQLTGQLSASQILHNRYRITQKLAQGGQSAVYLVLDNFDGGKQRAVKEMSEAKLDPVAREKAVNDFLREADMLRSLDHPTLAKVCDRFVDNQKHYLVMEYVQGHNLEDELIDTGRPLEWERVVRWGMVLCDVLTYLHSQKPPIIYRDLKPANVMLLPDGSLKLIDFGIARWLHPMRAQDTSQLGTDGYAPLEQYQSLSEPRSDLYALGASLYHLLTGHVPETAPIRITGHPLTPLHTINRHVPEPVERVVLRALNLQAEDRFHDAQQMKEALAWSITQQSGRGPSGKMPGTTPPDTAINTGSLRNKNGTGAGIGRSPSMPITPKLQVRPLRLDAGYLEANDIAVLLLEVANQGGGNLRGRTETNLPCLTVDPSALDGNALTLQVRVDTTSLVPGPYTCHLAIRTNGGDQIVPVRFVVRPPMGASNQAPRYSGR